MSLSIQTQRRKYFEPQQSLDLFCTKSFSWCFYPLVKFDLSNEWLFCDDSSDRLGEDSCSQQWTPCNRRSFRNSSWIDSAVLIYLPFSFKDSQIWCTMGRKKRQSWKAKVFTGYRLLIMLSGVFLEHEMGRESFKDLFDKNFNILRNNSICKPHKVKFWV